MMMHTPDDVPLLTAIGCFFPVAAVVALAAGVVRAII